MRRGILSWAAVLALGTGACGGGDAEAGAVEETAGRPSIAQKLAQYTPVRLTADLNALSERERRMIPLLIEAAQQMDSIFWQQVYPARDSLLATVSVVWLVLYFLLPAV